ncbi:MAG: nucleoside triphosphate pyrophosphohydrolase [Arenimonas sp.]|nr:nucleoside triphosphate pyrophosphohydrolase [Arenimonas sp.]
MSIAVNELLDIMRALRDKDTGCPWDLLQDFRSLAPYAIEEAYEVADAIERGDFDDLRDELGDLLLQVVFHAQLAQERGLFTFDDVATAINGKMLRRHPHVFGDESITDAEAQTAAWEDHKKREREAKSGTDDSALSGISSGLSEWQRATKLQKRAATVGFDWPDVEGVFAKLHEEIEEVRAEFAKGRGHEALEDEIGDILFVCVNLARHAKVDFGSALRRANAKFERRFRAMESMAQAAGRTMAQFGLAEQERLWQQAKLQEAANDPF